MTKTSSDSDYYYVDVKSSHKNVIFSNKGETQTSFLIGIIAVIKIDTAGTVCNSLFGKSKINLNKNKEWNGFSSVTCRFAQDDGTVLKTEKVSKDPSPGVFKTIAPSGATKIELPYRYYCCY